MRSRNHYLLAVAILATACVAGERHHDRISRKWPADGIRHIDLHEVDGSVDIEGTNSNEITLDADIRRRGIRPDPSKENNGFFEAKIEGDTLSIGRRGERRVHFPMFFRSRDLTVDYTLHVPRSVSLEVRTVNGRVETRSMDGETRVVTVNGPIDLESGGTQEVSAHTVNGRVKARFLYAFQGASLKTVNGSVDAELPPNASFACDLSQMNGDFEAAFPLNIHSHPGNRRVSGEVNGGKYDLRIVTVNGDIRIETVTPPTPSTPPAIAAPPAVPGSPAIPAPPAPPAPRT